MINFKNPKEFFISSLLAQCEDADQRTRIHRNSGVLESPFNEKKPSANRGNDFSQHLKSVWLNLTVWEILKTLFF